MIENINLGYLIEQVNKTHDDIAPEIIGEVCRNLALGTQDHYSIFETINRTAELNGWQPIPTWVVCELTQNGEFEKFLTNLQLQPEASGEWLHLYDDEDGIAWYTYIGDIVNEIYGEAK